MRFRNMLHDSTKFPSQYLALFLTNFPSLLFSDRKLGLIVCKCKVPHRLALRQAPLLANLLALIVVLDLSDEPDWASFAFVESSCSPTSDLPLFWISSSYSSWLVAS